jgi:SH3-like domain-containing protein
MNKILPLLFSLALASSAFAQTAVVSHNVNLRKGPSTSYDIKELLHPNDELVLLDAPKTNNYYKVRAADGEEGWVYGNYIDILDAPPSDPNPIPALFNGCSMEGSAAYANRRLSNEKKNRRTAPAPADIDPNVTLAALLQPSPDQTRWSDARAASIVGYVYNVKLGSEETVNCGSEDSTYMDTHIELVANPNSTDGGVRVIVEVTPRWRWFMAQQTEDWSTRTLKQTLQGHWVRFTGWLFWDFEHPHNATNTHTGTANIWRATAWELHPVTAIKLCPGTPGNCD